MASTTTNSGSQKQQIDRLSETAHTAIDRATQSVGQIAQQYGEKAEELLAMKDDYMETAREYVKQNPLMAVGIALAAGYLVGKITSWR
jgi:ElaB/YqjD/DUF883 family membrane-anchored ribosome-binding protein